MTRYDIGWRSPSTDAAYEHGHESGFLHGVVITSIVALVIALLLRGG